MLNKRKISEKREPSHVESDKEMRKETKWRKREKEAGNGETDALHREANKETKIK